METSGVEIHPTGTCKPNRSAPAIRYHVIQGRLFCLPIFMDKYSGCIVHHAMLTGMDSDSLSLVAPTTIEKVRKYRIVKQVLKSDIGSSFISMDRLSPDLPNMSAEWTRRSGSNAIYPDVHKRNVVRLFDKLQVFVEMILEYSIITIS